MILSTGLLDRLLQAIWTTALVLVVAGLIVMLALIFRRRLQEWLESRRAPLRNAARAGLMSWLDRGFIPPKSLLATMKLPADEFATTLDETAQLVKDAARERLAELGREVGVDVHLRRRLRARLAATRIQAARRLSLFADDENRSALAAALDDDVKSVRLVAAEAALRAGADFDGVLDQLWDDTALADRGAARLFLAMAQGWPEALARRLDVHDPAMRQLLALQALAEAGAVATWPRIRAMRKATSVALREVALLALVRLDLPVLPGEIEDALGDAEARVRRLALRLVPRHHPKIGRERLEALAADEDTGVRRAAAALLPSGEEAGSHTLPLETARA